jgi:hypothetical protein
MLQETFKRIASLCAQSQPVTLSNGARCIFVIEKQFTGRELDFLESKWHVKLPNSLRDFFTEVGAGKYFASAQHGGLEVRRIDDFLDMVGKSSRAEPNRVFCNFLPFGRCVEDNLAVIVSTASGEVFLINELPADWSMLSPSKLESAGELGSWIEFFSEKQRGQT